VEAVEVIYLVRGMRGMCLLARKCVEDVLCSKKRNLLEVLNSSTRPMLNCRTWCGNREGVVCCMCSALGAGD
jgi:hypothetical protein